MSHPIDQLPAAERVARIRLARSDGIGPILYRDLIRRFGNAADAIEALPSLQRRAGRRRPLRLADSGVAEAELESLARIGARCLILGEADYPAPLAAIDDPPPVLGVIGDVGLLARPAIAVVGARNASANGRRLARDLAHGIGTAGAVVVSGLARGIDGAAHEGALDTGTAAALAGGIDVVYPPEHEALHAAIAERGVLVSETPPGVVPRSRHFPRRNRVISGLALGVVVVEAALRSGSLITARLALEQGREVFAVPGSPLDPRCRGTNGLIRQGAVLVEGPEDVLDVVAPMAAASRPREAAIDVAADPPTNGTEGDSRAVERVAGYLGMSPVAIDELMRETGLSTADVLTALIELELAGRLDRHPGNRVSLAG